MQTFAVVSAFVAVAAAVPFSPPSYGVSTLPAYLTESTTLLVNPNPTPTTHHRIIPTGTGRSRTTTTTSRSVPYSTGTIGVPKIGTPKAGTPKAENSTSGSNSGSGSYKMYTGNGSPSAGWPAESDWVSDLDTMFDLQKELLSASCENIFKQPNNSDEENDDLKAAIKSESESNKIDPRFTLAIIMQESKGCVRAWNTTAPGTVPVNNPGMMQDHNGPHSCNTGTSTAPGKVTNPCPKDQISGQINDGLAGTNGITGGGNGFVQLVANAASKFQATGAQGYYVAARLYNSGDSSYNGNDLGAKPGATLCYSSDIANRLTGWAGSETECTLDKTNA